MITDASLGDISIATYLRTIRYHNLRASKVKYLVSNKKIYALVTYTSQCNIYFVSQFGPRYFKDLRGNILC